MSQRRLYPLFNAKELQQKVKCTVMLQEYMTKHTSWHIGGPADLMLSPHDIEDLSQALKYAQENNLPVTVIGNGTNLLVGDKGIRGLVIKIGRGLSDISIFKEMIFTEAGTPLAQLLKYAKSSELAGFEFLTGMPGTVGGALIMNAGANNNSIGDRVKKVFACDYSGTKLVFDASELTFAYRYSCLAQKKIIVTGVQLSGIPGRLEDIEARTQNYLSRRQKNQPQNYPNAGSVFKNPTGDSAGRLIELAGCKGQQIGNIQVSTKHANFFVNLGGGTAIDVLKLIQKVQQKVMDKHGVQLVLEIEKLGEF